MSKRKRAHLDVCLPPAQAATTLPCVCYYPSGKAAAADSTEYNVYARQSKTGNAVAQPHLVVATQSGVDFVGSSQSDEYSGPQSCSYAVGVYDKDSNKLQLVPIAGSRVFRLEPRLHSLQYEPTDAGRDQDKDTRELQRMANKRLVDEFGSTRRRRQLNAREEGSVKAGKLSGKDAVEQMFADIAEKATAEGNTKEEVMRRSTEARNIPPHNTAATTAEQAYPITSLISPDTVRQLDVRLLMDAAKDSGKEASLHEHGTVPAYVLSRLQLLRDPNQAVVKRRAQYLSLLSGLLKLVSKRVLKVDREGAVANLSKNLRIKAELLEELLHIFYVHSDEGGVDKYERPEVKYNLLVGYIVVCALLVEGGVLGFAQFEGLKNLLKVPAGTLVKHFSEVGAVPKATRAKLEQDGQAVAVASYNVSLLKDLGNPDKTLQACLPAIKLMKKNKASR